MKKVYNMTWYQILQFYELFRSVLNRRGVDYSKVRRINDCYKGNLADFLFSRKNKRIKKEMVKICNHGADKKVPMIIVGKSGSGKTHLANCIVNEMCRNEKKAVRITTEELISQLVDAIRSSRGLGTFVGIYYKYDVIIVDEIESLKDKISTLFEMARIIRCLSEFNVQVILMCHSTSKVHSRIYSYLTEQHLEARTFVLSCLGRRGRKLLVRRIIRKANLSISATGIGYICREENMGIVVGMLNSLLGATQNERKTGRRFIDNERLSKILGERFCKL